MPPASNQGGPNKAAPGTLPVFMSSVTPIGAVPTPKVQGCFPMAILLHYQHAKACVNEKREASLTCR
jgi:hypothetical protein